MITGNIKQVYLVRRCKPTSLDGGCYFVELGNQVVGKGYTLDRAAQIILNHATGTDVSSRKYIINAHLYNTPH